MNRYRIAAAVLATTALCAPALALDTATNTGNIAVSLTVNHECLLETTALSFGSTGVVDADVTGTSLLKIECTRDSAYRIGLSAGSNAGGTDVSNRNLLLTGGDVDDVLAYQLYSDATHDTVWGHTQLTNTVNGIADGTDQSFTIYGLIEQHQNAPAGAYTDTITATVWYQGGGLTP